MPTARKSHLELELELGHEEPNSSARGRDNHGSSTTGATPTAATPTTRARLRARPRAQLGPEPCRPARPATVHPTSAESPLELFIAGDSPPRSGLVLGCCRNGARGGGASGLGCRLRPAAVGRRRGGARLRRELRPTWRSVRVLVSELGRRSKEEEGGEEVERRRGGAPATAT